MSAQFMNPQELLDATASWAGPNPGNPPGPARTFLLSSPAAATFLPVIDRCRATLALAPAEGSELGRLTKLLGDLDADHDDIGRHIVAHLGSYAHSADAEIAALAHELMLVFFQDGLSFIKLSFADEAGRVVTRENQLTPGNRAKLRRFPLATSGAAARTLETEMDALQDKGRELGRAVEDRATITSDGAVPSAQTILDAKRELIRTITLVFSNWHGLDAAGLLDGTAKVYAQGFRDAWNERSTAATRNAAARRAGTGAPVAAPAAPPAPPAAPTA